MKKPLLYFSFLVFNFSYFISHAQLINTIAGNGVSGYSGDGGQATAAELATVLDVATDKAGNVYIDDFINSRIRMVDVSTGIISTVAGGGTGGDGGPATAAIVNLPSGVAIDTAGNLYIAGYVSNKIRIVTKSNGIINTIAGNGTNGYSGDGGLATAAELADPEGVSTDEAGNVYIIDTYNYRVRKVTISTGIITTIAGNGTNGYSGDGGQATAAEIGHAEKLKADAIGNIYLTDENNARVRYIDASAGIITTIVGNGVAGFYGDGGQATSAELSSPEGVNLNAAGDIFIADMSDEHIRYVDAFSKIITTVAGNGVAGFAGDGGPALNAEFGGPVGIALDKTGNLFIADQSNYRIREVTGIPTGLVSVSTKNDVSVYPVPNCGNMTIQLPGNGYQSIKVYDASGREVYDQLLNASQADRTLDLNLGNVSNGIYIVQIATKNGNIGKRIVITK